MANRNPGPRGRRPSTPPGIAPMLVRTAAQARPMLGEEAVSEIARFVRSRAMPGGGFRGRSAQADLYYSMFALWCLKAVEGHLPPETIRSCLDAFPAPENLDLVHTACAVEIAALHAESTAATIPDADRLASLLEGFRRADGGYASESRSQQSTLGTTYLALMAHQRLGADLPDADALVRFVERHRTGDGFTEAGGPGGGPTLVSTSAAAIMLSALAPERTFDAKWLWSCYDAAQGGFRAVPDAPEADLLSTAVALFVLSRGETIPGPTRTQTLRFVEELWQDDGGFRGSPSDDASDCEYTFYALLAVGALARDRWQTSPP